MNGNNLLIDTNIILYLLNGDETIIPILENKQLYVSFITQLELLSFPDLTDQEADILEQFLNECVIIEMSTTIKQLTIHLRKKYRLRLPDSIIAATAKYLNSALVTADIRLKKISKDVDLILYHK